MEITHETVSTITFKERMALLGETVKERTRLQHVIADKMHRRVSIVEELAANNEQMRRADILRLK